MPTFVSAAAWRLQIALLIRPRQAAVAAPSGQLSSTNLAAVVAPSVVGGSLLLAGAALGMFLVLRRSARKVQGDSQRSLLPVSDKSGSHGRQGLTRQPFDDGGPDVPRFANSPTVPLGPFRCVLCLDRARPRAGFPAGIVTQ
jgi:hypothetical protein